MAFLLNRAKTGDESAIGDLLDLHRERLLKMIQTRLNPRIRKRVDASDVMQESYLEAVKRLPEYLNGPQAPFFLWLRQITGYKIIDVHRRHLATQGRNADLEVGHVDRGWPKATSVCLATQVIDHLTTPSQILVKQETRAALQEAINGMNPNDREILALRHFEELTNEEAASEMGITPAAASKRFVRALQRLHGILVELDLVGFIG